MKPLIILTLIIYSVNGFRFSNIFSRNEEVSSQGIANCVGVPDGTKLPDEENCQKFTLCDGGYGLLLSCRSTDPYFDRCTSTCVSDFSVCNLKECPGESTTSGTTTTTTGTTTTTSTTTTSTTTTPTTTSTTTTGSTTTTFHIPTVPITLCNPACTSANYPPTPDDPLCTCIDRWVCKDTTCVCDDTIRCPTDLATCKLPEPDGCGCEEACSCTGTGTAEKCYCKADVVCPFPEDPAVCEDKCGCMENCNCTGSPSMCKCFEEAKQCPFPPEECMSRCGCTTNCDLVNFAPNAQCFETCKCQDDYLCPFDAAECVTKCKCEERCIITGNLARCDPDIVCTRNAHDFLRNFWHRN